jgi:pimeloyl-ACP methyl ester carboxylesterase
MEKLVVAGHSMGAWTILELANRTKKVKAVIALDPPFNWGVKPMASCPLENLSPLDSTKAPHLIINTERFPYLMKKTSGEEFAYMHEQSKKYLLEQSIEKGAQIEQVELRRATHMGQHDGAVLKPFEIMLAHDEWLPNTKYIVQLHINGNLAVRFLEKVGILDPLLEGKGDEEIAKGSKKIYGAIAALKKMCGFYEELKYYKYDNKV